MIPPTCLLALSPAMSDLRGLSIASCINFRLYFNLLHFLFFKQSMAQLAITACCYFMPCLLWSGPRRESGIYDDATRGTSSRV